MTFKDLQNLYDKKKTLFGKNAYKHISEVFEEAKALHKKDFRGRDHEQSWRSFKGKNLEKLVEYIITDEIKSIGLDVVNGNSLERTECANLSKKLGKVKRNLLIDFGGECGCHMPDVDIVVFNPEDSMVVAALSVKVTLRERIAQTGYWKLKLAADKNTKHIRVFFVTPDEDGTLTKKNPVKKGRAIVEKDLDGGYVMTETKIETSDKIKMFDKLVADLKKLIK
ncbi:MAG: DNA modification methylase [Ignavibacteria bacterium]|mgnify:CR=1 FL=1|jgi:type II restriction enzyme|nr:DNA modification methylase [Ignavibacteria bacterium]